MVVGGYGVIGGIGLGIGYISPVSTLIKWFPDRPGMATGMAIMGFGGGAMIGSPLAVNLIKYFATPTSTGVVETMVAMGLIYFVFMMFGVFTVRVPPKDWKPEGWVAPATKQKLITSANVTAANAIRTPQFWLVWGALFLNVSAGIGVLQTASPIIQQTLGVSVAAAAGFVGLLSLFNMGGRFFWSSTSDKIGRKPTYMIYFLALQHGRPVLLVVDERQDRPQADLHDLLRARRRPLRAHPHDRAHAQRPFVRHRHVRDHQHVRRRLLHRAGVPA
jgi:MFS family permease